MFCAAGTYGSSHDAGRDTVNTGSRCNADDTGDRRSRRIAVLREMGPRIRFAAMPVWWR